MKCSRAILILIMSLILVALASADSRDGTEYNILTNSTNTTGLYVGEQANPIFNNTVFTHGDRVDFYYNVSVGGDAIYGPYYIKTLANHSAVGYTNSSVIEVTVWAKQGLIPTTYTPGAPFYLLDCSNPIENNSVFTEGDRVPFSCNINATGLIDETYTLFTYANATGGIENVNSSEINVTIILEDEFPTIDFNFQTPADLNTSYYGSLNISYNISEATSGINVSTVLLHYKANSSTSDIFYFLNGTSFSGYSTRNIGISNESDTWYFKLSDNYFYPATYNFDEPTLENLTHEAFSLNFDDEYVRVRFLNFSNTKNYTIFEFMAQNQTKDSLTLRIYFCNESYTTGKVHTSDFCTNGYNLDASVPYNHEHSIYSSHHVISIGVDTSDGTIGGVYMPEKVYAVFRGRKADGWNLYYINNASNSVEYSDDNGGSWTNQSVTVDAHFHQYDGTDTFYYFSGACANNGLCINSSVRSDLFDLAGLPPSPPDVYSPTEGNYSGNIPINYTAAISPNAYEISHYNISLVNPDQTYNLTIIGNNSQNLNYLWDSTAVVNGNWSIRVQAYDVVNQTSVGYSELFTIDNIPPYFSNAINVSETFKKYTNFTANITIDDAYTGLSSYIFSTNNSGSWLNDSAITIVGKQYNASISKNISQPRGSSVCWYYWASDTAGSGNSSETYCFNVQNTAPTQTSPVLNASNIENRTNADLSCYNQTTFDLDDDPITNTYEWFRNSTLVSALINSTIVASGNTSKDDTWLCQVRPNDGLVDGISLNSSSLIILGTPPTIPSINITSSDGFNYSNGTISGWHNYYDIDSDAWLFNSTKWYKNNIEQISFYNLSSISQGNLTKHDTWIYSASVGNAWSNWTNSSIYIPNAPPYNNATIPNPAFDEDGYNDTINANDYFTDADLDNFNFTFKVNETNINMSLSNVTGIALITATSNWYGSALANITAWDETANSSIGNNFVITVNSVNDGPVSNATIPNITFNEDSFNDTLYLNNYFSDIEGDDLNFTSLVNDSNINISINNVTKNVLITATSNWFGTGFANYTAWDPYGASAISNNMFITVLDVNDPPVITGLPDREAFNTSVIDWLNITGYASDPEGNNLTYTISAENVSQINCDVTANGSSLTTQTNSTFYGTGNCTVQVDDGGGGTDTDSFNIIAWNKVGLIPTTPTIGAPFYLVDCPNPIENNSIFSGHPAKVPFSCNINASASAGTYTFYTYANTTQVAGNVNSTQINVTITLNPIITLNEPVADAQLYYKNRPFLFNFSVIGNDPFNCSLYLNNTLNQTNTSVIAEEITNFQPINLNREDFKWRVDCYDPDTRFGSSVNRILSILNSDPYYSTFPDIAFDEDTYNDTVNPSNYFVDDDGDDLNWTFEVSPAQLNMSINNNTNYTLITAVSDWNGIGYSNITAHDGYGGSNQSNTFTITVHPVNDPPTQGTPIINSTVRLNSTVENITVYNTSTYDVDDDKLTNIYNWYENGTSLTVLNMPFDTNSTTTAKDYSTHENNGTITGATWTPSGLDGGAYSFDGINDYIKIQNDSTIVWNGTDITFDILFKRQTTNNEVLFNKQNITTTPNYKLELTDNKLVFSFASGEVSLSIWEISLQSDFDEGTYYQTFYNDTIGAVQINQSYTTGNYTSKVFDATAPSQWLNFTYTSGARYGKELPNNKAIESEFGGADMTKNVFLGHFNDKVEDSSLSDNHGVAQNGAYPVPSGLLNGAGYFDGVNDYVDLDNRSVLNIAKNISVEAWVNTTQLNRFQVIFEKTGIVAGSRQYIFGINAQNKGTFLIRKSDDSDWITITDTTPVTANQWVHYAATFNGSNLTMFRDGVLTSYSTVYSGLIQIGQETSTISRDPNKGTGAGFQGKMDELAVWNKTLSGAEILQRYNGGSGSELVGNETNLVSVWHMNEGVWKIQDHSSELNNCTAYDGVVSVINGKLNSALGFNGEDTYLHCGKNESLNIIGDMAIEAWIKTINAVDLNMLVQKYQATSPYYGYGLSIGYTGHDGSVALWTDTIADWEVSNKTVHDGRWHHIAVVGNGTEGRFYVDGEYDTNFTYSAPSNNSAEILYVGTNDATQHWFDGYIDELAIYNRSLSAAEIKNHYSRGAMKLNISVRSCDDPICDGEIWNQTFNSSPINISVADNQCFQVRADFASDNETKSPELYNMSTAFNIPVEILTSTSTIIDNEFHNAIITYNSISRNISIYLDGILDATKIGSLDPSAFASDLFIGINYPDMNDYFNGTIDTFRIWNRTLSQDQILKNWQENKTADYKTLVSDETTLGNFYSSCITLNDIFLETTSCSPNLTIILAAPMVTAQDITMDEDTWNYTYLSDWVLDYDTPDSDINWTYNGTVVNSTLSISNVTKIMNITPLANKSGTFDITLTAHDPDSQSGSDSLTVTILPVNDGPYLAPIPNQDVSTDRELTYQTVCTDIDNTTLLYWVNDSIVDINGTGYLYDAPIPAEEGTYWINTTCGDGEYNYSQVWRYRIFVIRINFTYSPGISQIIFPINYSKFNFTSMTLTDRNVSAINQTASLPVLIFNNTAGLGANVVFKLNGSYPPSGWDTHKFRCSNTSSLSNSREINLTDLKFVWMDANSSANAWCWGSYLNASTYLDFNFSITND